jgi:hypoxanthine phosphoribosyltransferase
MTWNMFDYLVVNLASELNKLILARSIAAPDHIIGLQRGGVCLANALSYRFNVPASYIPWDADNKGKNAFELLSISKNYRNILVCDDIVKSGKTLMDVHSILKDECECTYAVLVKNDNLRYGVTIPTNTVSAVNQEEMRVVDFPWTVAIQEPLIMM